MTVYRHEIAEAMLAALAPDAWDLQIAEALADYMLAGATIPHKFSINHNAKAAKCPIRIDVPGVKKSSVSINSTMRARIWLIEAFAHQYEVTGSTHKGVETRSIGRERSRMRYEADMASYRAKRARQPDGDDEIPF